MSNKPSAQKSSRNNPGKKVSAASSTGMGTSAKVWIGVIIAVVVVGALGIALIVGGSKKKAPTAVTKPPTAVDSKAVLAKVTSVPASTFNAVGQGSTTRLPEPVNGTKITKDGKPEILYIGAEFCPYCAAERWAIANALSRFGTLANVGLTHSSSTDVFPNTPTLTFHNSTFTSDQVAFTPLELADNRSEPLDPLSPAQNAVWKELVGTQQTYPFVDIGGRYMISGAGYDPALLQGLTQMDVANAMHDPNSDIAKGAVGTANAITAAICKVTSNQPANVCSEPAVAAILNDLR